MYLKLKSDYNFIKIILYFMVKYSINSSLEFTIDISIAIDVLGHKIATLKITSCILRLCLMSNPQHAFLEMIDLEIYRVFTI